MVRGSNPIKVEEWTQRLARFIQSNLSVAQFCDVEGVSTASFYQWQRKLRKLSSQDKQSVGGGKDAASSSKPATPSANRRAGFQAVQVTSSLSLAATEPVLTVCLPGGIQVQVASHPAAIEAVMRQLIRGNQEPAGDRGAPAC